MVEHRIVIVAASLLLVGALAAFGASQWSSRGGRAAAPAAPALGPAEVLLRQLRGPAGQDKQRAAALHVSLGHIHLDFGEYQEAAEQYMKARELAALVGSSERLMEAQVELGVAHLRQGKLREAKLELEAAYLLLGQKRTPQASRLLQMLGNVHREMGHVQEAFPLYAQAQALPRDELTSLHNDIGRARLADGAFDQALEEFRAAARRPAPAFGGERPFGVAASAEAAVTEAHIGGVLHARGDAKAALEYYRRALRAQERLLRAGHPEVVATRVSIARALRDLGSLDEALQAIEATEALLGSRRSGPDAALVLGLKGELVREGGDPAAGEAAVREALAIQLACYGGEDFPEVALTLNALGSALHDQQRFAEALGFYRRALGAALASSGAGSLDEAAARNNLGNLYQDVGDLGKAKQEFEKSLEINLKIAGPASPDVGAAYNNLASILFRQGSYKEAVKLFAEAIAVADRARLPANSPDRQVYVENHQMATESAAAEMSGAPSRAPETMTGAIV